MLENWEWVPEAGRALQEKLDSMSREERFNFLFGSCDLGTEELPEVKHGQSYEQWQREIRKAAQKSERIRGW